jgi:hypothetical protein
MRRLALLLSLMLAPLPSFAQTDGEVRLKVLSFNIWYGGDQVSFDKVIEAIRLADADVVGLQEPDGRTAEIAVAAGYSYVDVRRHILSRYPLFDSGMGETQATDAPPYSTAGLDPDSDAEEEDDSPEDDADEEMPELDPDSDAEEGDNPSEDDESAAGELAKALKAFLDRSEEGELRLTSSDVSIVEEDDPRHPSLLQLQRRINGKEGSFRYITFDLESGHRE